MSQFEYTNDTGRPVDPDVAKELFLIALALGSLTRALEITTSFQGEGAVVKEMTMQTLRAARASTRAILKDD